MHLQIQKSSYRITSRRRCTEAGTEQLSTARSSPQVKCTTREIVLDLFSLLYIFPSVPSTEGRPRETSQRWGGMRYLRAGVVTSPPSGLRVKPRSGLLIGSPTSGHRETRKRTDTAMARRKTRTHPLMRQTRRFRVARRDPGR